MRSTSTPSKIVNLDPIIHERARLAIMSVLTGAARMTFAELKSSLDLSDGNLSVHLRVLEEAGFVAIDKEFVDRKPRTTASVTRKGRSAFRVYVDSLARIVRASK